MVIQHNTDEWVEQMSLKSQIVVVNEYSVPQPGGKGSRGGTPGDYVTRYMARENATESLAPITRLRTDDFIMRYMARESAIERVGVTRGQAKAEMRRAQGQGGIAFGYGSVSLSHEQLSAASNDIQHLFEQGHTVMKTVLSFDDEYLKKHGLVSPDFALQQRGDYRGHLDQMKLRMAVMHGLEKMAAGTGGFDDLRYCAVIQIDTEHPHVHLAMVDAGRGSLTQDGTQRGKLLDRHKSRLRRGVDSYLDEKQAVAHLASAVGYERRNVMTFIKRWAHEKVRTEALPQFLLACLPQDRTLWRAGSNDASMRKPNEIMRELVLTQLEREDSPMPQAMEKVVDYANNRAQNEGLDAADWQDLVDRGHEQILDRATNSVYQMLRALPPQELSVRTPMLAVMSMDYQQMAARSAQSSDSHDGRVDEQDALVTFGFRLRSYASRLDHHRTKAGTYRDLSRQWEQARVSTVVTQDSRPLYDFYQHEAHYHHQLVAKYQHFLPYMGDATQWHEELRDLESYGQRLLALKAMRADASLQRMKDSEAAERIGLAIYDQKGGSHLTQGKAGRTVLDARVASMTSTYESRLEDLRAGMSIDGLTLQARDGAPGEGEGEGDDASSREQDNRWSQRTSGLVVPAQQQLLAVPGTGFEFDEVKALDLHHLGYDFPNDVKLGRRNAEIFISAARDRQRHLLGAMDYLDGSGQAEAIEDLPTSDVGSMLALAKDLREQERAGVSASLILPSRIAEVRREQQQARSATTSLDAALSLQMRVHVDQAVAATPAQIEEIEALEESQTEIADELGA